MLKDANGTVSAMRVGFIICLALGTVLCCAGIIAAFISTQGAETMIVSGAGLMSTSGFSKSIQKRYET
tara:strand:- start:17857 stop:18060 length:204 start_codon:yes stop_codon:yes gene_type:complete